MERKELVKYFYEKVFSQNLIDNLHHYITQGCTYRIGEKIYDIGLEGMKQHIVEVKKTYPDFKIRVINQYCENDYVITEIIAEGTHLGEFLGIKPTGKKLTFTGVDIDKIKNSKIVEHGGAINTFETFIQEGVIKPHNE